MEPDLDKLEQDLDDKTVSDSEVNELANDFVTRAEYDSIVDKVNRLISITQKLVDNYTTANTSNEDQTEEPETETKTLEDLGY